MFKGRSAPFLIACRVRLPEASIIGAKCCDWACFTPFTIPDLRLLGAWFRRKNPTLISPVGQSNREAHQISTLPNITCLTGLSPLLNTSAQTLAFLLVQTLDSRIFHAEDADMSAHRGLDCLARYEDRSTQSLRNGELTTCHVTMLQCRLDGRVLCSVSIGSYPTVIMHSHHPDGAEI